MTSAAINPQPAPHNAAAADVPVVHLVDVGLRLADRWVLRNIQLRIERGESVLISGCNGAGKTMLLRMIAGLVRPTSGKRELFGIANNNRRADISRRIGLIGHQPMLYRELSPRANLAFFASLYGLDCAADRINAILQRVDLLDRADDPAGSLSRGMVQRLAIARAVLHEPELILADEPFAGLDSRSRDLVQAIFDDLLSRGSTLILAGHEPDPESRYRLMVLKDGRCDAADHAVSIGAHA